MTRYSQNAICPKCAAYTVQQILGAGRRKCIDCGEEFHATKTAAAAKPTTAKPARQRQQK